jgi:hypothetical protein
MLHVTPVQLLTAPAAPSAAAGAPEEEEEEEEEETAADERAMLLATSRSFTRGSGTFLSLCATSASASRSAEHSLVVTHLCYITPLMLPSHSFN